MSRSLLAGLLLASSLGCGSVASDDPDASPPPADAAPDAAPDAEPPPPPGCGNGEAVFEEECDDGNDADGDGCSRQCTYEAAPGQVAVRFVGHITAIEDEGNVFSAQVAVDTPFRGYYAYDPKMVDKNPDPTVGDFESQLPDHGVQVRFSHWRFQVGPGDLRMLTQNQASDGFVIVEKNPVAVPQVPGLQAVKLDFYDGSGTAAFSDGLPTGPLVSEDWPTQRMFVIGAGAATFSVTGVFDGFE